MSMILLISSQKGHLKRSRIKMMLRVSSAIKIGIQARNYKVNSFINMLYSLFIMFIGSMNQGEESDTGITVEEEDDSNEEEGEPDAISSTIDDEESGSQGPDDITRDISSIVKEVKESFGY